MTIKNEFDKTPESVLEKEALAQQEQPAQEPMPGMAVTALAGEIIEALLADEKDGGYDLTSGLFGANFSTLVRRWAKAEWGYVPPTQPAFTQEPPAKTGARIQAIVTSCLGCTHRRYNSGGIYYCEKLGSDLDPRETFHPLCPLQSLSPTQPALSDDEILNCFYASKSEGMASYMLAVVRAIEAHCRGGVNHG